MDFGHPVIQSGILPLTIAFVLTAMLPVLGRSGWGSRTASGAIGLALLASTVLVLGAPAWPAHTGMHKFFYLTAGSLLLGTLLDLQRAPTRLLVSTGLIGMAAAFVWLAWPQLDHHYTGWLLAAIWLVGLIMALRVARRSADDRSAPLMFLVAAASLGGIAAIAGSLSIAELGFALAAALAGFMLRNWPRPRYRFGAAGLLGAGVPVLTLALLTLLLTDVSPWSLTPLVLIFVADALSRHLPAGTGLLRQTLQPVYLVLVGSVPGAVAVALAWLTRQPDSLYYQ